MPQGMFKNVERVPEIASGPSRLAVRLCVMLSRIGDTSGAEVEMEMLGRDTAVGTSAGGGCLLTG